MATEATDTAKREVRFNFLLDNQRCAESQTVRWPAALTADDICAHMKRLAWEPDKDGTAWGIPEARSILFCVVSETAERVEITCRGYRDPADARAHVERQKRRRELEAVERRSAELRAEGERLLREAEAHDADQETARRKMKANLLASQAQQLEADTGRRSEIRARAAEWKARMAASNEELRAARESYEKSYESSSPATPPTVAALNGLQESAAEIAGSLRDLVNKEAKPERKTVSVERDHTGLITELTVDESA